MTDLSAFHDKSRIDAGDVIALRRLVYEDGRIGAEEARALLSLAAAVPEGAPDWSAFLAEAMADHLVHQATPPGFVSEKGADRLMTTLGPAEGTPSVTVPILLGVTRIAREIPSSLAAYALVALRARVLADGIIDEAEVEALRAFLFAAGGSGGIAVTREEADLLFDLNDAAPVPRTPAWLRLFADAVSAHLMAYWGGARPSREEAMRLHRFAVSGQGVSWRTLLSPGPILRAPGRLFARTGTEALAAALRDARSGEAAKAALVTPDEAAWLTARIGRDGQVTVAERALLERLRARAKAEGIALPDMLVALPAA